MGYSHYFKQKRDLTRDEWELLERAFLTTAGMMPKGVLCDWNGVPFYSPMNLLVDGPMGAAIAFTGNPGGDRFQLSREKRAGTVGYCKTLHAKYDTLVCATLMLVHDIAPDAFTITSDGRTEDWLPAQKLLDKVFSITYPIPV